MEPNRQHTERHDELQHLSGDWRGEETHRPAELLGDTRKAHGFWRLRPLLDNLALVGEYSQRRDAREIFAAHAVFSADEDFIYLHWLDSASGRMESYRGTFSNGVLEMHAGDQRHATRIRFEMTTDGRLEYELAFREADGSWRTLVEGDYLRYAEE